MKLLIIEDEYPAAERLQRLLAETPEPVEVLGVVDSVAEGTAWLEAQPAPDLILSDIQLADGLAFEIFERVVTPSPVIFTTSYDAYAIRAFKLRSIDYLLKPIKADALAAALAKFRQYQRAFSAADYAGRLEQLLDALPHSGRTHKERFLVRRGEQLLLIPTGEVAYFRAAHELVYLHTADGRKHPVEYTLEQIEQLLDPAHFFRVNRQFLVQLDAIGEIHTYFNSRLKLRLRPDAGAEVIVSRGKVATFRAWLEG
ncbi:MAG: LytTR family DNA-binding domain-containing protein [Catalinimonas sp.]